MTKCIFAALGVALALVTASRAWAEEQLKYGTAIQFSPNFYLPVLAAEEQGFFKKNGVNAEWFPARSGADLHRDLASSAVKIASSTGPADVLAIARGVPTVVVANLQGEDNFSIWVRADSRFHKPQDLKGAKLGVSQLGGAEHAYGRLVAKRLGLENDVHYVATGGIRESLAILQTGGIDGVVLTPSLMINLKLDGKVRELLQVHDYQASPWEAYTIIATKDFVGKEPATVERVVRSILEANRFVMGKTGKAWAIETMKKQNKYSDAAAAAIYDTLSLSPDGKIDRQGIKNLTDFMVEYGLLKQGELPPLDTLYTNKFVR